jgi:hypothetical protein
MTGRDGLVAGLHDTDKPYSLYFEPSLHGKRTQTVIVAATTTCKLSMEMVAEIVTAFNHHLPICRRLEMGASPSEDYTRFTMKTDWLNEVFFFYGEREGVEDW